MDNKKYACVTTPWEQGRTCSKTCMAVNQQQTGSSSWFIMAKKLNLPQMVSCMEAYSIPTWYLLPSGGINTENSFLKKDKYSQ